MEQRESHVVEERTPLCDGPQRTSDDADHVEVEHGEITVVRARWLRARSPPSVIHGEPALEHTQRLGGIKVGCIRPGHEGLG